MKKIMATIAVAFCALVVFGFGQTAIATPESDYNQLVDKRIAKLERQGKMVKSWSKGDTDCAEVKILQANFFRAHKDELVSEMVVQKVEMKPHKVNYFLIKAFSNANRKLVASEYCASLYSS
jgi:hypothetical protein